MSSERHEKMHVLKGYEGLHVPPRTCSTYSLTKVGFVIRRILDGDAFGPAMAAAGFSSATGWKWKRRAAAGEQPYHDFLRLCERAHRVYLERELGITTQDAIDAITTAATGCIQK